MGELGAVVLDTPYLGCDHAAQTPILCIDYGGRNE